MTKIMSTLVLLLLVGVTAYVSGTVIKADMAEDNQAQPRILENTPSQAQVATDTPEIAE